MTGKFYLFLLLALANAGNGNNRNQPNVILMMADDQDTELGSLQFMPKLTRYLREEGARKGYSASLKCLHISHLFDAFFPIFANYKWYFLVRKY